MSQQALWGDQRIQMTESIDLTISSLQAYGERFEHWGLAWSGGKDSSTRPDWTSSAASRRWSRDVAGSTASNVKKTKNRPLIQPVSVEK